VVGTVGRGITVNCNYFKLFIFVQHIGSGAMVIASFQQTLWSVQPVSSGTVKQKSVGKLIRKSFVVGVT
jgi:hypothetical protein